PQAAVEDADRGGAVESLGLTGLGAEGHHHRLPRPVLVVADRSGAVGAALVVDRGELRGARTGVVPAVAVPLRRSEHDVAVGRVLAVRAHGAELLLSTLPDRHA